MPDHERGLRAAALTYALRDGWTEAERDDLTEALELVKELLGAYHGFPPEDLTRHYGHEYEDHYAL